MSFLSAGYFKQDKPFQHTTITKYFQLRHITTILLLTTFLVLQYARQVSYWECRLSNYFKTETEKCDCEKLIRQVAGQSEPPPVPAVHNHFHLDESFYHSGTITEGIAFTTKKLTWCTTLHIFIKNMIPGRLDRPPQIV